MASKMKRLGWLSVLLGLALWALCAAVLPAQTAGNARTYSTAALPATADAVIEEMAGAAGVIFAGQVTAVRGAAGSAGPGIVEVEFRVDETVKGPAAGSVYTLREWAGLWNSIGSGRYRIGQRLLVFLYAPDANGLSSPVRGLDGAIPLRGGGKAPGPNDATAVAADWLVDLRWVQAQALKTYAPAAPPGSGPVFPRPIMPVPVASPIVYPPPAGVGGPEVEAVRGALGVGPLPVRQVRILVPTPLPVQRAPILLPAPPLAEVQPLAQVIALCRQVMRSSDGLR